jgi:hypothetical protein
MKRTLTAVTVLTAAAVMLAAFAAAGPVVAKQRVAIELTGGADSFVLTTLTPGPVKGDTGTAAFCCWTSREIVRGGQSIDLNNPQMTLTGKRGTIVARNNIGWVDIPGSWSVFTGTWTVLRGTGAYAGLSGGGRGAGVQLANGNGKSRFEGFLSLK